MNNSSAQVSTQLTWEALGSSPTSIFGQETTVKEDEQSQLIRELMQIGSNDVLCGKSGPHFRNEGNQRFRRLIAQFLHDYRHSSTKKSKMKVIQHVVDVVIARGGRFLVVDKEDGSWVNGGPSQGKRKAGFAFRDAARGKTKLNRNQMAFPATFLTQKGGPSSMSHIGHEHDDDETDDSRLSSEWIISFSTKPTACASTQRNSKSVDDAYIIDPPSSFLLRSSPDLRTEEPVSPSIFDNDEQNEPPPDQTHRDPEHHSSYFDPNTDWLDPDQLRRDISKILSELSIGNETVLWIE
jgi:hypothetical protein